MALLNPWDNSVKPTTIPIHHLPPGEITVGGEIGHRMDLTANKILHHMDVEHFFARHYAHRCAHPDVPGEFTGYGMLLDAVVKAAMHGIGGEEMRQFKDEHIDALLRTQYNEGVRRLGSTFNNPGHNTTGGESGTARSNRFQFAAFYDF